MKARIYRSSMREFDCALDSGEIISATALGNLLKDEFGLVIGDYVEIEKADNNEYTIVKRYPRTNEVFRILVRESKKKITAANVDTLVVVMSVSKPSFKRGVLDRFLVRAAQWEIPAFIIFNKMDQFRGKTLDLTFEQERLSGLGAKCFEISALQPDYRPQFLELGMDELKQQLCGKTGLLVGHSGVGKSETISSLSGGEVQLRTRRVGKAGKGSHTTTWSEIVDFGDFSLIDSPGIRSFSIDDIDPEELIIYYPDLAKIAGHCQFFDCQHMPESKGCAFWEKFDPDTREGEAVFSRLESYQRLRDETAQIPHWRKKL